MSDSKALARITTLLDDNSFVEIGALVTARSTDFNTDGVKESSDGVICGHGLIDGRLVFVYSQDSSVLNGTIGEMHSKKIAAVYDMATKVGAPVVGFIDCGGVRLKESMDAVEAMGSIIANAASASGVIPQISAIYNCGGGLSVLPALSDYVVMENDAKLFLNTPDTIKDNRQEVCDSASAEYQFKAGNVDFIGSDNEIISKVRECIEMLPSNNVDASNEIDCQDDLNRASSGLLDKLDNMVDFAKEISDNGTFLEFKAGKAKAMRTGLIRLNGSTVGFIGNEKKDDKAMLCACGLDKATDFVNMCDAYDIPLVVAVNEEGYKASFNNEDNFAKKAAKFTLALKNADVPKISIMVENAIGSGYLFMNSKAISADMVYAFPDVNISMMDADKAAKIICEDTDLDVSAVAAEYQESHCGINNAARRGYVDRILEPANTRKYLIAGLEMLYSKNDYVGMTKHSSK